MLFRSDEPIVYPPHLTQELDYELELALVLKKSGKHFSAAEASDYVGGYVIFNDVTARDIQRGVMKTGVFSLCIGIDSFCPLGPWIVTPEELRDPDALELSLYVNGTRKQHANTSSMIFPVARLIAELSKGMTLLPGDVIATGTPEGVGFARNPPEFLADGDVLEVEIEGIGTLRNRVRIE